jgi:Glycosyltransferase family 9 (heptosyltransferase)
VIIDADIRGPSPSAFRNIRNLPRFSLVIDHRTDTLVIMMTKLAIRTKLYQAASPGFLICSRAARGDPAGRGRPLAPGPALYRLGARRLLAQPVLADREVRRPRQMDLGSRLAPVMLLGPDEQDLRAPLREALPEALFPAGSNGETLTDVRLSLALGARLSAAVAMDTGIGHLLAAAGTPLVSLFGPSNPERWKPVGSPLWIVSARPYGGPEIARIPVTAVSGALNEMMGA